MSIPGSATPLLLAATAAVEAGPFQINRSLRFNSADTAYLNRTPSSAGNRKTWTWSGWVKRSELGARQFIFEAGSADTATDRFMIRFEDTSQLTITTGQAANRKTDQVFRDTSSWGHLVVAVNTTLSTANDRIKVYWNGSQIDINDFSSPSNPSQDANTAVNSAAAHSIGKTHIDNSHYLGAYLADVHLIDGQALAPTDFGETDSNNNWNPKAYSGSHGTNGFHLDFSDASSNSALGDDSSGNNNDWTVNNLVAASKVWSNLTTPSNTSTQFPYSRGFDGVITGDGGTAGFAGWLNSAGNITITFPSGVSVSNTINIYSGDGLNGSTTASVTVSGSTTTSSAASGYITNKSFSGISGNLESITLTNAGGGVRFYGIKIDGTTLVDVPGSDVDSLIDTPTNADADSGNNIGNYPTFNPLSQQYSSANHVLTNGNLQVGDSSTGKGNYALEIATMAAPPSNKWYWEMTLDDANSAERRCIGIIATDANFAQYLPQDNSTDGFVGFWCETGQKIVNGSRTSYGSSATEGDIIGVALDQDSNAVAFYKNNNSQGSISLPTNMQGKSILPAVISIQADENVIANFGQRPFAYTPPTNYKSLCTQNLTNPTIADGSDYFKPLLYTGTGSQQDIGGLDFSPDWLWIKRRDSTQNNILVDIIRGSNKELNSNATTAEGTFNRNVTAFNSDGFRVLDGNPNANGATFVAWCWDGGTLTDTSNTAGSITPTGVRANASTGFSIVTWTGDGGSSSSVGHGLNAAPNIIIIKCRGSATDWHTYVRSLDANGRFQVYLNKTNGSTDFGVNFFNGSSSVINLNSSSLGINGNGSTYVAYCFAPVAGFSAFGKYTGNGSTDGPFVPTDFRPALIAIKRTDSTGAWKVLDTSRSPFNVAREGLDWNTDGSEFDNSENDVDILSNGFKLRTTHGARNASNGTFVYMAWAEHPFKTARAR